MSDTIGAYLLALLVFMLVATLVIVDLAILGVL